MDGPGPVAEQKLSTPARAKSAGRFSDADYVQLNDPGALPPAVHGALGPVVGSGHNYNPLFSRNFS